MLGLQDLIEARTNFKSQYLGCLDLGSGDGHGVALLCASSAFAPEWAMETLCDDTSIPGSTSELFP